MTKICSKCGVGKALSEFYKDKRNKDGLAYACKGCKSLRNRQYHENNKEKIAERKRQYKKNNKEKVLERELQYYENNKEKILERHRQWYEKNKEKRKEQMRQYRESNKEKIAELRRQYRENNKEKILERKRQYRENNKEKILERKRQYRENLPAGIYKITNKQTGVIYIGCSTQLKIRFAEHKSSLKKNKHRNKLIQEAYNQCGLKGLKFEIIKEYPADTPFEVLEKEETRLILENHTKGIPMYNLSIKINSIDENLLTK